MEKRGRKKGCTDVDAGIARDTLYAEYDKLVAEEKQEDAHRAAYLPRMYYVDKLFDMRIALWSKSSIRRLLMYRFRYDRKRER